MRWKLFGSKKSIISLVCVSASASVLQKPLSAPRDADADKYYYQFKWPIQKVAIIGAGPSGLNAYRELSEAGFHVRIFERDNVPGGTWHYTEEVPLDAPVPNAPAPVADYVPSFPPANVELPYSEVVEDGGKVWRDHRGPKPVWESLTSNTPWASQQFSQWPWPDGTRWKLSHYQLRNYVRSYASYLHINSNDENPATAYNTRVERIEKRINEAGQEQGWRLWLRSLKQTGENTYRATWWTEDFDAVAVAVAVAVGIFNAPSMPSIPGLEEWVQRFPSLVRHSRQYRRPEPYANQTVLIVSGSVSGSEISRDLNRHAGFIYQSFRPDIDSRLHYRLENYLRRLPENTTLVGEIKRFLPIPGESPIQSSLVELRNGTILSGIDSVILATGYRYSFPFLPQYYDGATYVPHEGSSKTVSPFIPLDGSHVRDLYLDTFYIRDPTLAFIGMMSGTHWFSLSEYLAVALAKVWSNAAKLPSSGAMRESYERTVEERGGYGKYVLFLGPERTSALIRFILGWLNDAAVKYGGKQIDGLPKYSKEISRYWLVDHYEGPLRETLAEEDEAGWASLGFAPMNSADREANSYDVTHGDNW